MFRTLPALCPYLPGRTERRLIADLTGDDAAARFDELSRAGFRRSHGYAYRPACVGCAECVAVRVRVADFQPNRTQRRVLRANDDLTGSFVAARATDEHFRLFGEYQRTRHGDGDMALMTFADYRAMVEETPVDTALREYRDSALALRAVCLVDQLGDGPSAVYSFFDPDLAQRSLGNYMVLDLIAQARAAGQPYVYLGYWIAGSRKMSYKARFRPLQALGPRGWRDLGRSPVLV
jgi:arginine-tRNA-protein transferase